MVQNFSSFVECSQEVMSQLIQLAFIRHALHFLIKYGF